MNHLPSPIKFREDINGLRAWAVFAVLLYHFSLIGLPGGYAGVDIFFVISGYLMTSIIVKDYENNRFSIADFYMARARRILPALLVVIFILLIMGWFWLPTISYQSLATQSLYSLMFSSNIYFWQTTNYFAGSAPYKWLLHTWSLAVEAQFYVLYPIFFAIIWKIFPTLKAVTWAISILFSSSLLINLTITEWFDQSIAFYLLPARGWELMAGALVFLISKQLFLPKNVLKGFYWMGWLLIGASLSINKELSWPGYWAILPVLGTSLIILAQKEDGILTNSNIAQWIGDRSYSLYLWHWPLIVALVFLDKQYEWQWVVSSFTASIVLAHLSYKFIETPTRKYLSKKTFHRELIITLLAVILLAIFALIIKNVSFKERIDPRVDQVMFEISNKFGSLSNCWTNQYFNKSNLNENDFCSFNTQNKPEIALIGDSHTGSVISALIQATDKEIKFFGAMGCAFIPGITNISEEKDKKCAIFNDRLLELLMSSNELRTIVIVNRMNDSFMYPYDYEYKNKPRGTELVENIKSKFEGSIDKLLETGKQVYILQPIPEMFNKVPNYIARSLLLEGASFEYSIPLSAYDERSKITNDFYISLSKKPSVHLIDVKNLYCDSTSCYGSKDLKPYYFDDNHLTEYGNKLLIPAFQKALDNE